MTRHVEGWSMLELCGLQCSLGDGKTVESRMSAHRMIPAKITIIVICLGLSDSRNNYFNDIKAEPGHSDHTNIHFVHDSDFRPFFTLFLSHIFTVSQASKNIFRVTHPAGRVASYSNMQATFFYLSCI
jgi:hypothetical protein